MAAILSDDDKKKLEEKKKKTLSYKTGELLHDLEDIVESKDTGKSDPVLVDDGDIEKISSILGQSSNRNLIYVGKSGLGKTAAIEGIARRKLATINGTLAEGEKRLPLHMVDRRFLVLDVNTLFSSNDPEKIEADIKRIFTELDRPGEHVLIIEDANQWLKGVEDNQVSGLISTFVKGLIEGKFQSILMVRDEPGKNNLGAVLSSHSEIAELFTVVEKKPPSKERVLEIMAKTKSSLESHHDGLHINDDANAEIVNLTFLYPNLRIYMREQPARALRMRDQIASTFVTREQSRPKELNDLESRLEKIRVGLEKTPDDTALLAEKAEIDGKIADVNEVWEKRAHDLGAAYRAKRSNENELLSNEQELETEMAKLREKWKTEKGVDPTDSELTMIKSARAKELEGYIRQGTKDVLEADDIAKKLKGEHNDTLTLTVGEVRALFGEISGIPAKDLNANEAAKALTLGANLKDKIYGQDEAVDVIDSAIKRTKAGLKDPNKPIGSFIMLGSSGIGKSFLAECLAEELYDDKDSITVFDMSEFMEKHTVSRLIGAPPGYAGYGEGGALVNAVRRKPYQVILLDEVEKAHPDVFKVLLQVLDKGRLSDELGTGDFRNVVFIMTTNLGQHMSFDADRTSANSEADIKAELRKIFPQELINRIDSQLLLKAHTPENIERIVGRDMTSLNKRLAEKKIEVDLPKEDIKALVADRYKPEEGARQVQKFFTAKMTGGVADIVLSQSSKEGGKITARYDADGEDFKLEYVPRSSASPLSADMATEPEEDLPEAPRIIAQGGGAAFGAAASIAWQRAAFAPQFAPMMA